MTKGSHDNEQTKKLHHPADDVTNKLLRFAIRQKMLKTDERASFFTGTSSALFMVATTP